MPDDTTPPARSAPSKAPSWITVGFVLGLLVFYTVNDYLHRPAKPTAPQPAAAVNNTPTTAAGAASAASVATPPPASRDSLAVTLQAIDIIFRKWAVNALWDYDKTEILLYNPADNKFSIPVEVTRRGVDGDYTYFYRPIDALTRPLLPAPDRPGTVIRFTENEEATKAREEKTREMWNAR